MDFRTEVPKARDWSQIGLFRNLHSALHIMSSTPPPKPPSSEDIVAQKVRIYPAVYGRNLILKLYSMTAAVCNRFLLYIQIFSSTSQRIRGASGGFTSQVVRLKHSASQPSIAITFLFCSVVSASVLVSLHPSSSSVVRDSLPYPHLS